MLEVCDAIIKALVGEYMHFSSKEEDWRKIAKEHAEMWQLTHRIGAIDGKNISLFSPVKSGSTYFNYKGFFSIVLLALLDADYKFTYLDIDVKVALVMEKSLKIVNFMNSLQAFKPIFHRLPQLTIYQTEMTLFYSNLIAKQTFLMLSLPMMHFLSPVIQ